METSTNKDGAESTGKILMGVSWLLKGILLVGLGICLYRGHWFNVFLTAAILITTSAVPFVIRDRSLLDIPIQIEFLTLLFLFASIFLGSVHGWYEKLWWWDLFLHTWSGFILGLVGFLLVYTLNEMKRTNLNLNPLFVAIFSFSFAVCLGTLWEILEFGMDQFFGMTTQEGSLVDTMGDLVVDTIGAAFIAFIGYGRLKFHVRSVFLNWMDRFRKK